jgi:hypothetical protein
MEQEVFTIYGLRRWCDREVRYVGQTKGSEVARLMRHLKAAERPTAANPDFCKWLMDTWPNVEPFVIAKAGSAEEANDLERDFIVACQRLGQRVFNVCHADPRLKMREMA